MKQKPKGFFTKGKQKTQSAVDLGSVLLVCLFPLLTGAVFFRLLYMAGVPLWFYIIQGLIFAVSLGQAIYFFAVGLIRALRRDPEKRKAGK